MDENSNKKIWFKAKRYGWGWRPVTWQGWVVTAVYVFLIAFVFASIDVRSHSVSDTLIKFAIPYLILTAIFVTIGYKKGERPCWNWGDSKKQQ